MRSADPALALVCAASFRWTGGALDLPICPGITESALILSKNGAATVLHVEEQGLASMNTLYSGRKLWEIRESPLFDNEEMELQFLAPIGRDQNTLSGLFGKDLGFLPTSRLETTLVLQQEGTTVITLAGKS